MNDIKTTDPAFNPSGSYNIANIKEAVVELEQVFKNNAPQSRRLSIALTHLEIAAMFAVKAAAVGDE